MTNPSEKRRIDSAARVIAAPPEAVYAACVDPKAFASWLPPQGMTGRIHAFEPRPGGAYRMSLTYDEADHAIRGKTSEHSDMVSGRFAELVPNERIVQLVRFESDDPAFAGEMRITWRLAPSPAALNSLSSARTCRRASAPRIMMPACALRWKISPHM